MKLIFEKEGSDMKGDVIESQVRTYIFPYLSEPVDDENAW